MDGPSLTLTLDADLQKAMEEAFQGRAGSAVALDPETGEILAMTSTPAYDPNQLHDRHRAGALEQLTTDPDTPLMNRVIQGTYAPGSLFKVVMADGRARGRRDHARRPPFYCPGYSSIYGTVFRCHKAGGPRRRRPAARPSRSPATSSSTRSGCGSRSTRLAAGPRGSASARRPASTCPTRPPGSMPSPEWKLRVLKAPWYAGETVSVAIGQGQVTVTPLQMARARRGHRQRRPPACSRTS